MMSKSIWPQDAQKGRSARPQASRNRRRYPPHFVGPFAPSMNLGERKNPSSTSASENLIRYVEDFDEPRTTPAGFFSILLEAKDIEDDDAHKDTVVGKRSECMALHKREKGRDHNPGNDEGYDHPNPERQVVILLKDAP
jgi:hypothetical protein